MNTEEYLNQAVQLYNSGDKLASKKILNEIVSQDPTCADAWYGLALCASTDEERRIYVRKVLSIDPSHQKALRMQCKLQEQAKQDETGKPVPNVVSIPVGDDGEEKPEAAPLKKRRFSSNYIYAPVLVLMIGFVIWQYFQIDELKKALNNTRSDLASAEADLSYVQSQVRDLNSDISTVQSNVRTLASGLDYATSLAENADYYSHSHNSFSDARLKTDIQPIDAPLSKIVSLNGVYYLWDTQSYPKMAFSNDLQIGLIAQDVEAVLPELVTTDTNGYKLVDYERLTAVLIEAIKEQQRQIDQLEQRYPGIRNGIQ